MRIPLQSWLPAFEDGTWKWGFPGDRFKHIEIEINTACDLACFACDRFSDLKETWTPNMTVDQVGFFVDESIALKWRWERIRLLGGEPTLHPKFEKMIDQILRYRQWWRQTWQDPDEPKLFLQVLTNGRGKSVEYRKPLTDLGISLHAEIKSPGVQPPWFNNFRIAPIDRDPDCGELPPCGIFATRGCGIGLTRHGYFLDGAGAAVARVAGLDIGVMELAGVTWDAMMEQARILCRLCGHWNPMDGSRLSQKVEETGQVTGAYWQKKLAEYSTAKPCMRIYGKPNCSLEEIEKT
jgi:hypothetical protein